MVKANDDAFLAAAVVGGIALLYVIDTVLAGPTWAHRNEAQ
jgi:hypothetical protein